MDIYNTDFEVDYKVDRSPLTLADQKANEHIVNALAGLTPDIPVLSEEGKAMDYQKRKDWERLWLVDPVDGTKEFIKKNGEFTVNIALIQDQKPVLGVVFAPALGRIYFSSEETGAYQCFENDLQSCQSVEDLLAHSKVLPLDTERDKFTIVASRLHMSPETETYIERCRIEHGEIDLISAGSSLKLCLVADGSADVYPRFAPTMEWDTAAGHAVALGAGCEVINPDTGESLRYNKEDLLNPWFLVRAKD